MPQIRLEYSANLKTSVNFSELLYGIHEITTKTIRCDINDCKSRIIAYDNYFIGKGEKNNAMVHLEINILEGRTDEQKSELAKLLLDYLESSFNNNKELNIQITTEIKDIIKKNYHKIII